MLKSFTMALLAALGWSSATLAEVPKVVASVKPIHALVSAVMGDLGTPALVDTGVFQEQFTGAGQHHQRRAQFMADITGEQPLAGQGLA